MDRILRDRTLKGLSKEFTGEKRKDLAKLLVLDAAGKRPEFDSARWKKSKTFLKKETSGKCAYCEANTDVVAHGDVEHFRPKSTYWWLAYSLENYFYSCQICNQTYKSDNFPIKGTQAAGPDPALDSEQIGLAWPDPADTAGCDEFHTLYLAERPLIINPLAEDPAMWFTYTADDDTQRVKISPANKDAEERAKTTIEVLGLNRDELQLLRYEIWADFDLLCTFYSTTKGKPKQIARKGIKRYLTKTRSFSAMTRHLATKVHNLDLSQI